MQNSVVFKKDLHRDFICSCLVMAVAGYLSIWVKQALPIATLSLLLAVVVFIRYGYRVFLLQKCCPTYYNNLYQKTLNAEYKLSQEQILIAEAEGKEKLEALKKPVALSFASLFAVYILPLVLYNDLIKPKLTDVFPHYALAYLSYLLITLFFVGCCEIIYNYLYIARPKNVGQLKGFIEAATPFMHISTTTFKTRHFPEICSDAFYMKVEDILQRKTPSEPKPIHLEDDLYYEATLEVTGQIVYMMKTADGYQPVYQSANISEDREEDIAAAHAAWHKLKKE